MSKDVVSGPVYASSVQYGNNSEPLHTTYTMGGRSKEDIVEVIAKGDISEVIRKMCKGGVPIVVSGTFSTCEVQVGRNMVEKYVLLAEHATLLAA